MFWRYSIFTNRAQREWGEDRFVRVSFSIAADQAVNDKLRDHYEGSFFPSHTLYIKEYNIYATYTHTYIFLIFIIIAFLNTKFKIGGIRYEFVGASDSMWRNSTCYYFAVKSKDGTLPEIPVTSILLQYLLKKAVIWLKFTLSERNLISWLENILIGLFVFFYFFIRWLFSWIFEWMGDFDSISIPSKKGTRMGMCFSPTLPTIVLEKNDWVLEDDPKWNGSIKSGCYNSLCRGLCGFLLLAIVFFLYNFFDNIYFLLLMVVVKYQ